MPWPEDALPTGAFAKADDDLTGGKRVVLAAIEPNEPMLASKMTGPGQRATLSAMVRDGLKAVTIRVNDVDGVGGFVLPGDHVDVVADAPDRQGQRHAPKSCCRTCACWRSTRSPTSALEKPAVVKAVTLEVDVVGAQKLSLAASVGSLSLMLRKAGEANDQYTRRITLSDLSGAHHAGGAGDEGLDRTDHRRGAPGVVARGIQRAGRRIRVCTRPPMGIGSGAEHTGTTGKAKQMGGVMRG